MVVVDVEVGRVRMGAERAMPPPLFPPLNDDDVIAADGAMSGGGGGGWWRGLLFMVHEPTLKKKL